MNKHNIGEQAELLNPTLNLAHSLGKILAPVPGLAKTSMSLAHWSKTGKQSVTLLVLHGTA